MLTAYHTKICGFIHEAGNMGSLGKSDSESMGKATLGKT